MEAARWRANSSDDEICRRPNVNDGNGGNGINAVCVVAVHFGEGEGAGEGVAARLDFGVDILWYEKGWAF